MSRTLAHRPATPRTGALLLAFGLAASQFASPARADDPPPGRKIYEARCASCHGAQGEGTLEEYPHPLAGRRPLESLTKYVAETMPADDPGNITSEESQLVSAYIYEEYYSQAAQARNTPRLELSRLTVRQYQNTVSDLVGSFRGEAKWGEERGLKGQYFKSRRRRGGAALERVDPEVSFDFGVKAPDPEKLDAFEFTIQWEGSVLAPETGEYEFIVKTDHATRLWVNDPEKPLIDAFVKSGNDNEYRGSIRLLGGRPYTLRLEFSKAKQGVDDSDKRKGPPPEVPAFIRLEWKPPHRAAEVIPRHCLSTTRVPRRFVVAAPFPPDDRTAGYERGTSISREWEQATTEAAIETAGYVSENLRELAGTRDDAPDRAAKLREFATRFAERAFRRPLSDELRALYIDRQFEDAQGDPAAAVKRVVLLVLKSPRFLYREPGRGGDAYDVAARLAFDLWDSLPDTELLKAAASNQLANPEQVARQAERMLADLRARAKVRDFLMQWLKVDQTPELAKDKALFPEFDEALASDLRTSLDLFLDDAVWGDASDFRSLLLSEEMYLNGRLAKLYGADLPADAPFQKVRPSDGERAGIISHPYLMSLFAYTQTSSPIHRGVFLARGVLGRALRPPPIAVAPLAPDLHAGLTTRERVSLQTSPEACLSCHTMINSLGFTLENFDALGRYRREEQGKPVDASGWYQTTAGEERKFAGVRELATFLSGHDETHGAFVDQLFHYLVKQPIRGFGLDTPSRLREAFVSHDFNIRKLIIDIATTAALPQPPDRS